MTARTKGQIFADRLCIVVEQCDFSDDGEGIA